MKGEISYRHPAVNIYAFCCKVGQYVGIDFLLEPVAIQGTAVLHIFFVFFCFRRQRILLAKEKSRNVEKVEQSVNIVYFCITLCHYLATFETIQWKQRGRWIELLLKRYDKLDDDDILLFVCVLFCFLLYLAAEYPGQARCQTASGHLFGGPTLAGDMCGRFLLN